MEVRLARNLINAIAEQDEEEDDDDVPQNEMDGPKKIVRDYVSDGLKVPLELVLLKHYFCCLQHHFCLSQHYFLLLQHYFCLRQHYLWPLYISYLMIIFNVSRMAMSTAKKTAGCSPPL